MDFVRKNPGLMLLIVFVLGLVIGLVVLGWGLFPLEFTDTNPDYLSQTYKDNYARAVADAYSFDHNTQKVQQAFTGWAGVEAFCDLATRTTDPAEAQRLNAAVAVVNNVGCDLSAVAPTDGQPETTAADEEGGSSVFKIFLGILLVVLVLAIFYLYNRRKEIMASHSASGSSMPDMAPIASEEDAAKTTPIASVDTTYVYGDDRFEYSFPIENEHQEFLGDCGIAIAESLGSDSPKNVAAFELWLFDKNDIRTCTKVLMSEHAIYDEGVKVKLATKGTNQLLAREGETLVLETISLILNAVVTEIEYGTDAGLPPESYFQRFSVKFHVWQKEGEYEPDIEGRVEELQKGHAADEPMDDTLDF
ncbi:MAG: hypothetical protein CSA11_03040 [Chloroflexi bacterium]|nr:MAG: hypothetical protein CSB13_07745 [Chloroflexota bacterium]PIE81861.1 MAG: hypothetical protein CSA11_03040 [Chloroflexota bacterium]